MAVICFLAGFMCSWLFPTFSQLCPFSNRYCYYYAWLIPAVQGFIVTFACLTRHRAQTQAVTISLHAISLTTLTYNCNINFSTLLCRGFNSSVFVLCYVEFTSISTHTHTTPSPPPLVQDHHPPLRRGPGGHAGAVCRLPYWIPAQIWQTMTPCIDHSTLLDH